MGFILLTILIGLTLCGLPRWRYSRNWGYGPSGFLGLVAMLLLALMLVEIIPRSF